MDINIGQYYEAHADGAKKVLQVMAVFRSTTTGQLEHIGFVRTDATEMPELRTARWVAENIGDRKLVRVENGTNKATPGIRCADDLPEDKRDAFNESVNARLALISPVLKLGIKAFASVERGREIARVCSGAVDGKRHSRAWVRKLLWRFWAGGAIALGDRSYNCGSVSRKELILQAKESSYTRKTRPGRRTIHREDGDDSPNGGCHITAFDESLIKDICQEYFNSQPHKTEIAISLQRYGGLPWTKVWEYVVGQLARYPDYRHLAPSDGQVKRIARRWVTLREEMRAALGNRHVDLNYSPRTGDSVDVSINAGTLYQLDPALADIFVTDEVTKAVLGRPNIIYVVDGYSGLIVGIYFTLDDINYGHVARALHWAFSSKPELCSLFGYTIAPSAWPARGRPGCVDADNADMRTHAARVVPEMIADVGICRPYRGTDKAYVETTVQLANIGAVHIMHYGVTKGPKQRAKEDPRERASVTFSTFIRAMLKWVVEVGNHRPIPMTRRLDPEFIAWAKANNREHTVFALHEWNTSVFGGPPAPYDGSWYPRLLERKEARITPFGLDVEDVVYDDPKSDVLKQMKLQATVGAVKYTPVHYDRLCTRQIYLVPEDISLPPVVVPLSRHSNDKAGKTFAEVEHEHNHRDGKHKTSRRAHAKRSGTYRAQIQAEIAEDKADVRKEHGSYAARKHSSEGTDIDKLCDDRIKADNDVLSDVLHPPIPGTDERSSAPPPACRPSLYD